MATAALSTRQKSISANKGSSREDGATAYAKAVSRGTIIAGPEVRAACARHLLDLRDGRDRGLRWDVEAAQKHVTFFPDVLRFPDGSRAGEPFALEPWQQFIVGSLFGWKGEDGARRFRTGYVEVGKGNGKALALDTPILTANGWSTMGTLQVGDPIYGDDGRPCHVTGVSDVMTDRSCYRLRCRGGADIVADGDHLWLTSNLKYASDISQVAIRTTTEIACNRHLFIRGTLSGSEREIISCNPVASVPVRCISVSSPSRMFLAGHHLLPTHNSPLAAGIGLQMLTIDGEMRAEIYAAATTRDQARIMFTDAVNMVDASPALGKRLQKSGIRLVLNLAHMESGSFFRPVSSEGRGLEGKRVHCALVDELHQHPSGVVVNMMRFGTKGRKQALIVEITNSGVDKNSICYQHHEYSHRVVSGQVQDDSWFAYVCALDDEDDPFISEKCWVKANPNLGVSIQKKYLVEQIREAKGMPRNKSLVQRLNFCQWVEAYNPAIPSELWQACIGEFDEADLQHLRCRGGLDLSGSRDLTAHARVYEPDGEGVIHAVVDFWTPLDTLQDRSAQERVPYDLWVDEGFITATPGRAVDYSYVAQHLANLQADVGLEQVAFDPYRIKYLEMEMSQIGCALPLVSHGQGYRKATESDLWMPRSLELLEKAIAEGKLKVKLSKPLNYAAASAVHVANAKGEFIYDKMKSTGRIDGIVALAMAIGSFDIEATQSVYETMSEETEIEIGIRDPKDRTPPPAEDTGVEPADGDEPAPEPANYIDQAILQNPSHPRWEEMRHRFEDQFSDDDE